MRGWRGEGRGSLHFIIWPCLDDIKERHSDVNKNLVMLHPSGFLLAIHESSEEAPKGDPRNG